MMADQKTGARRASASARQVRSQAMQNSDADQAQGKGVSRLSCISCISFVGRASSALFSGVQSSVYGKPFLPSHPPHPLHHALVPRPNDDRRHARTHELLPPRRVCARARPVTLSCAVLCLVHVEGIPVVPQVCAADATVPAPARTSCAQSVSESESES